MAHRPYSHRASMLTPVGLRALLGAIALVTIAAAPAAAQSDSTLGQRLDSIAGHWVQRKYAVGIVAAVVQGNDTLLMQSYGKADVEWEVRWCMAPDSGASLW